jgi:hypothetical protein
MTEDVPRLKSNLFWRFGMKTNGNTTAQEAELLGMAPGIMEEKPVVVLTFRPDPAHFKSINLALSAQQFKRLVEDGQKVIDAVEYIASAPPPVDPYGQPYGQPEAKPKKGRKK